MQRPLNFLKRNACFVQEATININLIGKEMGSKIFQYQDRAVRERQQVVVMFERDFMFTIISVDKASFVSCFRWYLVWNFQRFQIGGVFVLILNFCVPMIRRHYI